MDAVRAFDGFSESKDPYQEHDFGSIIIQGHKVFWKIDAYDLDMLGHSPNPTDPSVTTRVLTIMLADEY